jgi:hypothetical protein
MSSLATAEPATPTARLQAMLEWLIDRKCDQSACPVLLIGVGVA